MSSLFLWIGLTMIVALPKVLETFTLGSGSGVLELVGAFVMVIGAILLALGR